MHLAELRLLRHQHQASPSFGSVGCSAFGLRVALRLARPSASSRASASPRRPVASSEPRRCRRLDGLLGRRRLDDRLRLPAGLAPAACSTCGSSVRGRSAGLRGADDPHRGRAAARDGRLRRRDRRRRPPPGPRRRCAPGRGPRDPGPRPRPLSRDAPRPSSAPPRRRRASWSPRRAVVGLAEALRHDLALVDPDLDADAAGRGLRLDEAVVDVGADRVQRDAALAVRLAPAHLAAAEAARALDLHAGRAGADRARRARASSRGGRRRGSRAARRSTARRASRRAPGA